MEVSRGFWRCVGMVDVCRGGGGVCRGLWRCVGMVDVCREWWRCV